MRAFRDASLLLCAGIFAASLGGCSRHEEGAAEKAGKAVDDAMRESAQKMNQAGQKVGEAMQQAGEKMGESMPDTSKPAHDDDDAD